MLIMVDLNCSARIFDMNFKKCELNLFKSIDTEKLHLIVNGDYCGNQNCILDS